MLQQMRLCYGRLLCCRGCAAEVPQHKSYGTAEGCTATEESCAVEGEGCTAADKVVLRMTVMLQKLCCRGASAEKVMVLLRVVLQQKKFVL